MLVNVFFAGQYRCQYLRWSVRLVTLVNHIVPLRSTQLHSAARETSSLSWRVGITLWAAGENPDPQTSSQALAPQARLCALPTHSLHHRLATRKGSNSLHTSPSCREPTSCQRSHPWHSSSHQPIPCQDLFVTLALTVALAVGSRACHHSLNRSLLSTLTTIDLCFAAAQ